MSRFFEGSRMFAKSSRADEDNVGNSRSPRKEAPSERVKKVQINKYRIMLAVLDTDGEKTGERHVLACAVIITSSIQCQEIKWFDPGSNRGPSVC